MFKRFLVIVGFSVFFIQSGFALTSSVVINNHSDKTFQFVTESDSCKAIQDDARGASYLHNSSGADSVELKPGGQMVWGVRSVLLGGHKYYNCSIHFKLYQLDQNGHWSNANPHAVVSAKAYFCEQYDEASYCSLNNGNDTGIKVYYFKSDSSQNQDKIPVAQQDNTITIG